MNLLVVCMFLGAFLPYFKPGCGGRLEVCLLDYRKLCRVHVIGEMAELKSYVFVLSSIFKEKIQCCTMYFILVIFHFVFDKL